MWHASNYQRILAVNFLRCLGIHASTQLPGWLIYIWRLTNRSVRAPPLIWWDAALSRPEARPHQNREAIDILTRGTELYRKRAGRESMLRAGGWNFLITDQNTMVVIEASADRYAIRYAGDELPFTGPDWTDPDFIAVTNHFICDNSYDALNQRSGVPMTIFNEGVWRNIATGQIERLTESGERFYTLLWDVRHNYGQVDRFRAQQILSGLYINDKDTGKRIEVAQDNEGDWHLFGRVNYCTVGKESFWVGTCDAKVAVEPDESVSVLWTTGSPIH